MARQPGDFRGLIRGANALAHERSEILTLAHLYVVVLDELGELATDAHRGARQRIVSEILDQPQLKRVARGVSGSGDVATFSWQDADRSYRQYSATVDSNSSSPLAARVLRWLLDVGFEDVSQKACRELCRRAGVGGGAVATDNTPVVPELGFGRPLDAPAVEAVEAQPIYGRDAELTKHLGFLTLALQQNGHYLLAGKPGVGKTFFLAHLLARALRAVGAGRRFVLFGREDFLGSEDENKERFGRLYSYLNQTPEIVPVFDELEHVLRHAPNLAEHFSARFGSRLAGGGRTFILVCETSVAAGAPLLKGIRSCPLPPLPAGDTRRLLVESVLPRLIQEHELDIQPSAAGFTDALLNLAPARYPGRFLPELALYIAESAMNRARNRVSFLREEPFHAASVEDLWGHIVDEQGLNPEVFGKDPKAFYRNLRTRLAQQVIGQDHAVDQIASVLESQAQRPPQRAPRGRFLCVGPPGVGKTQLARSLARELGFGDEAFFVFNMSEYSSESARTRFMGADPGYVGFSSTRTIYQCVRERPACVILLDEIDRADATIQDILLSIMEGEGKDAEGQPVYFSQSVIIMTTNLGQEAVQAAYAGVAAGQLTRGALVEKFGDEQLRRLVLEGATDETEVAMQAHVDGLVEAAKHQFEESRMAAEGSQAKSLPAIDRYASLKELRARLDRQVRTCPLDRALLDRIDFILPFFPIKERALLDRILDLKLNSFGWKDCPSEIKTSILDQATAQKESVRPLERLVKKYLCAEPS